MHVAEGILHGIAGPLVQRQPVEFAVPQPPGVGTALALGDVLSEEVPYQVGERVIHLGVRAVGGEPLPNATGHGQVIELHADGRIAHAPLPVRAPHQGAELRPRGDRYAHVECDALVHQDVLALKDGSHRGAHIHIPHGQLGLAVQIVREAHGLRVDAPGGDAMGLEVEDDHGFTRLSARSTTVAINNSSSASFALAAHSAS